MRFASRRSPVVLLSAFAFASTVAASQLISEARAWGAPGTPTDDTAEACFSAAERAQPLLRQRKLREARAVLEVCTADACPRVARTDCREWLAEATDAQPSIVIAAHEIRGDHPPHDVHAARAVIDDALVVDRLDATPIVIDPGHHRLRLEREGVDPILQDIDIRDGEKGRVVNVYWRLPAEAAPARPVPPSVFVTGAVGLVAAGVGTYFEISGLSQRHDLDASCRPTASCTQSQVDSARTQVRVGDITLGGGILFLAGAMVLYFTRPSVDKPLEPEQTGWIGIVPGGFVAGARGTL
jgi:hypothetical protein